MIHYSYIPTCSKPGYWRSINHTLLNLCDVRCEALSVGLSTLRLVDFFFYYSNDSLQLFRKVKRRIIKYIVSKKSKIRYSVGAITSRSHVENRGDRGSIPRIGGLVTAISW
jgi:hypothetical protein